MSAMSLCSVEIANATIDTLRVREHVFYTVSYACCECYAVLGVPTPPLTPSGVEEERVRYTVSYELVRWGHPRPTIQVRGPPAMRPVTIWVRVPTRSIPCHRQCATGTSQVSEHECCKSIQYSHASCHMSWGPGFSRCSLSLSCVLAITCLSPFPSPHSPFPPSPRPPPPPSGALPLHSRRPCRAPGCATSCS